MAMSRLLSSYPARFFFFATANVFNRNDTFLWDRANNMHACRIYGVPYFGLS
jgi:hypothetical protein